MTTHTRDSATQNESEQVVQDAVSLNDVAKELQRARQSFHGTFASAHEGYAVILEELDELKADCFMKRELRSKHRLRSEAIQVAAMALRFASDLTPLSDDELVRHES